MPKTNVLGNEISYSDTGGAGTAVLFIPAFPFSSEMWGPQIDELGNDFRVITPDLKGFGASDAPDDRSTYSMDAYADELAALLDEAGAAKVVVVGLSMGGYIAFSLWRRHKDRIAGLVLADTRAEADPPEGVEKRTGQQKLVGEEGPGALTDGLLGALLGPQTKDSKPEVVEKVRGLMDQPAAGYIGALEAMKQRVDSTADLSSIDVPTLIIVGEDDALTPPNFSRSMHEQIAGSRLVVIPGAGHLSNLETPKEFNSELGGFLSSI